MSATVVKKEYDVRAIMCRAWAIRRAAAESIGCAVSAVAMGDSMRLAWAEAEGAFAESNAAAVVSEWRGMSGDAQRRLIASCIRPAAKAHIKYSTEDHYLQFADIPAFACFGAHDYDEYISETCIRVLVKLGDIDSLTAVNLRRASHGKKPLRLIDVVFQSARVSIAAVCFADSKHSAAYDPIVTDAEGHEASYIETRAVASGVDVATSAVLRVDVASFRSGLDDIGRKVLDMVIAGKTEREIAAAVGISNVAVHKRIQVLKKHMRAADIA